ncbi:MAG TPA: EamA family transporter [Methylomirabilota bacterium]|nr:EamA family transporter [Methylomirabilota bacterium]
MSQFVGMLLAVGVAAVRGEAVPAGTDLLLCVVAGVLGGIGITALYRGLALGRMAIVAPVTGVLAAVIPVVAGIILEGLPAGIVLAGIGLAIVSVVLVSRVADEGGGRAGLTEALIAGVAIGCFGVVISRLSDGQVFSSLTVIRLVQAVLVIVLVLATRAEWRLPVNALPAVVVVGVLDMAGNSFYLLAVQTGALAVASVLSALYPVATVVLAAVVLHERVTRDHTIGIALAATAIVLIGVGSA